MRVAFYLRVSTDGQTTDNQRQALEAVAKQRGWKIVGTYDDAGISGAKGREHRRQFDQLLKDATRGKFDMVAAWSVDRLGRSLSDLVGFLKEIQAANVELYLHQQALDTSTPAGRALFQMMGIFAEFERAMIQERVKAGMKRAAKAGKHLGRPPMPDATRAAILKQAKGGASFREIGRKLNVSDATVRRTVSAA